MFTNNSLTGRAQRRACERAPPSGVCRAKPLGMAHACTAWLLVVLMAVVLFLGVDEATMLGQGTSTDDVCYYLHARVHDENLPRVVHQAAWENSTEGCFRSERCFRSGSGYTHRVWRDHDVQELLTGEYPWIVPYYHNLHDPRDKAAVSMAFILYHHGGIYAAPACPHAVESLFLDTDLPNRKDLVIVGDFRGQENITLVAARKLHPLLMSVIFRIPLMPEVVRQHGGRGPGWSEALRNIIHSALHWQLPRHKDLLTRLLHETYQAFPCKQNVYFLSNEENLVIHGTNGTGMPRAGSTPDVLSLMAFYLVILIVVADMNFPSRRQQGEVCIT